MPNSMTYRKGSGKNRNRRDNIRETFNRPKERMSNGGRQRKDKSKYKKERGSSKSWKQSCIRRTKRKKF